MSEQKLFTAEQLRIVGEYVQMYGLTPEQIAFDGSETNPIFDYEATCLLSLKLTDIQSIDCWISGRENVARVVAGIGAINIGSDITRATARCTITLPYGRTRTCEDSAQTGEILGNGHTIDGIRFADSTAQNRAVRRGIRSVGVNLHNAHQQMKTTGSVTSGDHNYDPQRAIYNEIHAIAAEVNLIVDGDRTAYEHLLDEMFKVDSSKKLNDLERHTFLVALRGMRNVKRNQLRQAVSAA